MKKYVAMAAAVAGVGLMAGMARAATSYTITFSDVNLGDGTTVYGYWLPLSYSAPELAGSGITASISSDNSGGAFRAGVFYGQPETTTNDHTDDTLTGGSGAQIYNTGKVFVEFNQPVYVWSSWLNYYANFPTMTVSGFTNTTDTTPVKVDTIIGLSHAEPWRDTVDEYATTWQQDTGLGWTPVTKLEFYSDGYINIDDLQISLAPAPVLGDTNEDYVVDISDYNNVINNFGGAGLGDTNNDGMVDVTDFNNVINNFGADPLNGGFGTPNVPEPASMGLLAIGALGLLRRRR